MKAITKSLYTKPQGTVVIPVQKNNILDATLDNIAAAFDVSNQRLKSDFKADFKEITSFFDGDTKIYLLGLGEKNNAADFLAAFRTFSIQQKNKLTSTLSLDFIHSNCRDISTIQAAVNGVLIGTYRIGLYKSDTNSIHPLTNSDAILTIFSDNPIEEVQEAVDKAIATAETQTRIMDLVNAAPNVKTPQYLAKWAEDSGKKYGFKTTIFDKKQCEEEGLHSFLSVNKGSEHEPCFIIMEYKPKNREGQILPKIGLVGKGITFDTGGISIKPSSNLHLMKSDMGGAAAVFGTMELVAKLGLPIHLIGIVPSTENMVDGASTKPGDVIKSYLGKTIEVIDTDAEGRLILIDGLTYLKKNFNPDSMIDLATLTGSIVNTLGYNASGLFCNNDTLANAILQAGEATGERVWRMPIWDVYMEDMKSDIADIANLGNKPMAGAITAAKFLEFFIDGHTSWAHLDIAGTVLQTNELGSWRNATAYGIRLLTAYLESLISDK
jgi:leucyl aminopeptidase